MIQHVIIDFQVCCCARKKHLLGRSIICCNSRVRYISYNSLRQLYYTDCFHTIGVLIHAVAETEETTTAADSVTSTGAPPNTDAPTSIGVPTSTGAPTGMITMMITDTGATSGQSGGATDLQGGEMTTSPAEQAQTVPRSNAMKQSGSYMRLVNYLY